MSGQRETVCEMDTDLLGARFFCWRAPDESPAAFLLRVLERIDDELHSVDSYRIELEEARDSIASRLADLQD